MLRRKTVTERETRIKFACLALLSSVLMPTNLNMKISREYAEAIEDLGEFFAYPWGRVAFEMLMGSIKERDEITLSQNTIAVKGFALALQLVMVEAVPSLTEVVQETCSSSESDSADDVEDGAEKSSKKQTLSPAHARSIDKKPEVYVKSIIDQDPERLVDESTLTWSDDEEDEQVDNVLKLIEQNHKFCGSMFKGGATKADVEKMRAGAKARGKEKKTRKQPVTSITVEPDNNASNLFDKIKPELLRIDGNVSSTMTAVKDVNTGLGLLHGSIVGQVEVWLGKFKEECSGLVAEAVKQVVEAVNNNANRGAGTPIMKVNQEGGRSAEDEFYDTTIRNVIGNINKYATPPRVTIQNQGVNATDAEPNDVIRSHGNLETTTEGIALSATSHTHNRKGGVNENVMQDPGDGIGHQTADAPNFSLGLTQCENRGDHDESGKNILGPDLNVSHVEDDDNSDENFICRKSKRQKAFPSSLLADYHCGPEIQGRGRQAPTYLFVRPGVAESIRKYEKLQEKLESSIVINVGGCSVSEKDLIDIAERTRPLTAKAVDILSRIVRVLQQETPAIEGQKKSVFFDTKFMASLSRNYSKFGKSKTEAFPYLLIQAGGVSIEGDVVPMIIERVKGVAQNTLIGDSAVTAVVLMWNHCLGGLESCRSVNAGQVAIEAKAAAVMAYELNEEL
ncbi:hypothetical protein HID58_038858 [Brassica napus]|uniref:DUF1985 domain-containing protein n=1 Tax=Brassica napus TaxID=3708 RepID=A0ABQ8BQE6_BRANA|nr:hypothetical protein HID58_038858 [Brassica napus]